MRCKRRRRRAPRCCRHRRYVSDAEYQQRLDNAGAWQDFVTTGDINEDGKVDRNDALAMYYAYVIPGLDANTAAARKLRRNLLRGLVAPENRNDEYYLELLERANALRPAE